jgi:hypothetical protein
MRPSSERGPSIPWIPIAVVAGIGVVVGLLVYLVWQSNQTSDSGPGQEAAIEGDPAPDLPGEFVDLQSIYEGYYGSQDGPNTNAHVTSDVDYTEQGLPPTGGPHWGSTACAETAAASPPFCGPIPWGIYREPWPAESVVHALEHGGMAVWYNTTDQAVIDDLEDLVREKGRDDYLIVMVPYPDMEPETVAVTAWARRDKMPVSEYDRDRVENFLDKLRCRFNPEEFSGKGC